MEIFRKTFVSLAALCVSFAASAHSKWSTFTLNSDAISIRVVIPTATAPELRNHLATAVHSAIQTVETKNQGKLESSFTILFDDGPADHNGMATVLPRDFIWVYTAVPGSTSSIATSKDFWHSTLVHEIGHLYYLQKRRGVFRGGHWVFGNLSSPLGSWPRWLHEGWATWVENRFAKNENGPYLNFLKRTYAAHVRTRPHDRLTTSDLEGKISSLERVNAGEIPYAFGENLVQKILSKVEPAAFLQESANSLGVSFRKSLQNQGVSVDEIFRQTEAEWGAEPLSRADAAAQTLATHKNIYSLSPTHAVAEIDGAPHIVDLRPSSPLTTYRWIATRWHLEQIIAHPQRPDHVYIAYARKPHSGLQHPRLEVSLFRLAGTRLIQECTIWHSQIMSLVRFEQRPLQISMVVQPRLPTGLITATEQNLNLPLDCFGAPKLVATPASLSPRGLDTQTWRLTTSHGAYAFDTLVGAQSIEANLCQNIFAAPSMSCVVGIHARSESRRPVVIAQISSSKWVYKFADVETGAREASLNSYGLLWVTQQWHQDLLQHLPTSALRDRPATAWTDVRPASAKLASAPLTISPAAVTTTEYSPWSTTFPHYWMPQMFTNLSGVVLGGQAWFHDITRTIEGSATLGYDTYARYPYVSAGLSHRLGNLAWPSRLGFSAYHYRDKSPILTVENSGAQLRVDGELEIGPSLLLTSSVGTAYRRVSINDSDKNFVVPSVGFSLRYRQAPALGTSVAANHSEHRAGATFTTQLSRLSGNEVYLAAGVSHRKPISWLAQLEYGESSAKNLPYSYLEWGGYYPVHVYRTSFVSRGFVPRASPALKVARASLITGWSWGKSLGDLGWSRFNIENLSQDIIAETVTFESAYRNRRGGFGQDYYSTIGSEISVWMKSLFYVRSRAFAGIYQGFGNGGETRVAVGFSSLLDI